MFQVNEVASYLGISKPAIYKKYIRHAQALEGHIHIENGIKKLDQEGLNILMATMGNNNHPSKREKTELAQLDNSMVNKFNRLDNEYIELLKQNIIDLKKTNDDLLEQLKTSNRLLENEQQNSRMFLSEPSKKRWFNRK